MSAVPQQPPAKVVVNELDPEADDFQTPDNYVTKTVQNQKRLPPITWSNLLSNIQWISTLALTIPPALSIYGLMHYPLLWKTFAWS